MARILFLSLAVLVAAPAAANTLDNPSCRRSLEAAQAGLTLSLSRVRTVGLARGEETCSAYRSHFLEAVKARQATAVCKTGADRDRDLGKLDGDIDAINGVIATRCG